MLFEQRIGRPEVTSLWVPIRDLFLSGKSRHAWGDAQDLGFANAAESAEDWVLLIELARAVGRHDKAMALSRLAFRRHPAHQAIQIFRARADMARGRFGAAVDFLNGLDSGEDADQDAVRLAELASAYADIGLDDSANECASRIDAMGEKAAGNPTVRYMLSCAYQAMRRWELAVDHGKAVVAMAPRWLRARGFLVHCLLSLGRVSEAVALWEEGRNEADAEESGFELLGPMIAFSRGELDDAATGLREFLKRWPECDTGEIARHSLYFILVELGRREEARAVRAEFSGSGSQDIFEGMPEMAEEAPADGGRHVFIPLPIGSQNKNHCVPTAVAMATHSQGRPLDPVRLFEEMQAREGTALWRMREWLVKNDFAVVPVKLDAAAVRGLLDLGIPLVGALESPFSAHVDVICGYNEELGAFYLRDPSSWSPGCGPYDAVLERYAMHDGLYAIIEAKNGSAVAAAEAVRSDEAGALLDLAEHVAKARREPAETAHAVIGDSSPAAFLRDSHGVRVTISPLRFQKRCEAVGKDKEAPPVARFRSLLSLDSSGNRESLDSLVESQSDILGRFGSRYVRLIQAIADGDWTASLAAVDRLLVTASSVAQIWGIKSDVLAELGLTSESEFCLLRAIELMPRAVWLREKLLRQNENRLTFAEFLEEIDRLIAEDPDQTSLLWGRALALQDGPDGPAYEEAIEDYIRHFPRDPNGYFALSAWLNAQAREDLARAAIARGRELLDEEDLPDPFADADTEDEASGEKNRSEKGGGESDWKDPVDPDAPTVKLDGGKEGRDVPKEESGADPELPEERDALIALAGAPFDPLHRSALGELESLAEAGSLAWHEHARLVVCRILSAEAAPGASPDGEKLDALLPDDPPGARYWYATTVADILTGLSLRPLVAKRVEAWVRSLVPEFKSHASLWFQRNILIENMGAYEKAIGAWEEYLKKHHADSSAYFRLGVIKGQQSDYPVAARHFRRALEINPGLPGAQQNLLECAQILGDKDTERSCIEALRKKFPYQVSALSDAAQFAAETDGESGSEQVLSDAAPLFTASQLAMVRAQVALKLGKEEEAAAVLGEIEGEALPDSEFEIWLRLKLRNALEAEDSKRVIDLCAQGLARWPDSTRLKEIRAEHMADGDPVGAVREFKELLLGDDPSPAAAFQFLSLGDISRAFSSATGLVTEAEVVRRETLAQCFVDVFGHPMFLPHALDFRRWCSKQFSQNGNFRSSYALFLHANGRSKEAATVARNLVKDFPEEPGWKYVLGRVLIDTNPKKALKHLEEAYDRNRSSDYLFDLARCHHVLDHKAEAVRCHREVLGQNPLAAASLTSLHILGEKPDSLWEFVNPMIDQEHGADDEYFLVAAVKIAKAVGAKMSPGWLGLAAQRSQILNTHPGFKDEKRRLPEAIAAWYSVRPSDLPDFRPGFFCSLRARWIWPGTKWVPADD